MATNRIGGPKGHVEAPKPKLDKLGHVVPGSAPGEVSGKGATAKVINSAGSSAYQGVANPALGKMIGAGHGLNASRFGSVPNVLSLLPKEAEKVISRMAKLDMADGDARAGLVTELGKIVA